MQLSFQVTIFPVTNLKSLAKNYIVKHDMMYFIRDVIKSDIKGLGDLCLLSSQHPLKVRASVHLLSSHLKPKHICNSYDHSATR